MEIPFSSPPEDADDGQAESPKPGSNFNLNEFAMRIRVEPNFRPSVPRVSPGPVSDKQEAFISLMIDCWNSDKDRRPTALTALERLYQCQ